MKNVSLLMGNQVSTQTEAGSSEARHKPALGDDTAVISPQKRRSSASTPAPSRIENYHVTTLYTEDDEVHKSVAKCLGKTTALACCLVS